jgi:serine-type D-Ala-D-Ala carboxypeptidase/endopeptidase (penicillin-binding protein 4)
MPSQPFPPPTTPPRPTSSLRRLLLLAATCAWAASAGAQNLPPEVEAALHRAKVPREALSVLVVEAQGNATPRLSHRAGAAMNPASVMKLVTTYAALDLLGPSFSWATPVYVDGPVRDGTLTGNLYIQGQGDPKLVLERLWLLLRRVQGLGIRHITGDVVLDRSAFTVAQTDPSSFDGEPLRPYNAAPDALLINFKAVVMTMAPEPGSTTARIQFDPPLAGVQMQATVPLAAGECGDYRGGLKADFSDPNRIRFGGSYPASCGEKVWPVAYVDPKTYATRAVQGMWQELGGKIGGTVRMGTLPPAAGNGTLKPTFEVRSPPLAELVRDINKYSNNVMAQQVFLTLGAGTLDGGRDAVLRWWKDAVGGPDAPVLDNGSGLSRTERISAQALGRMLQSAYASPLMPELMSSLPIAGVDGTMRRVKGQATGSAHLKTGSLMDVVAVAGYVHAQSGKRYVLIAIVNHANAKAARPAVDALVEWAVKDR